MSVFRSGSFAWVTSPASVYLHKEAVVLGRAPSGRIRVRMIEGGREVEFDQTDLSLDKPAAVLRAEAKAEAHEVRAARVTPTGIVRPAVSFSDLFPSTRTRT